MEKRIGVYAGTFDPPTSGHLWMMRTAAPLFDTLIVAIGVNPEKKCLFSLAERLEMLQLCTVDMPNVEIDHYGNDFLVNYAQARSARFILRGIRNTNDFGYEICMRHINEDINPSITTIFLTPPSQVLRNQLESREGTRGLSRLGGRGS